MVIFVILTYCLKWVTEDLHGLHHCIIFSSKGEGLRSTEGVMEFLGGTLGHLIRHQDGDNAPYGNSQNNRLHIYRGMSKKVLFEVKEMVKDSPLQRWC